MLPHLRREVMPGVQVGLHSRCGQESEDMIMLLISTSPGCHRTLLVCKRGSLLITLSTKLVDVNAGTRRAAFVQYYFYYGVSKRVRRGFHFAAFAHGRCSGLRPSEKSARPSKQPDDDVFYLFLQKQKLALSHIPFGY
jgi:hypothetical protein